MSDHSTENPPTETVGTGDESARVRTGCIVAVALLIVTVVAAAILITRSSSGPTVSRVAFFPNDVAIDTRTDVTFHGEVVGSVDSVVRNVRGIQLLIERPTATERDVITLTRDGDTTVRSGSLTVRHIVDTEITISVAGASVMLRSTSAGVWQVFDLRERAALARHNGPVATLLASDIESTLRDGDLITLGDVEVEWHSPALYSRTLVTINAGRVRELAGPSAGGESDSLYIGAGSALSISNSFGLSRPSLTVVPAITRRPFLSAAGTPEIIADPGFDIAALLGRGGGYLFSPGKMDAPPRNNAEKIVAGLVRTLDTASAITGDLRLITSDAGNYLATPEGLNSPPTTRLQAMVNDINITLDRVKTLDRDVRRLAGTATTTIGNIDHTTRPRLDTALGTVREVVARAKESFAQLDSVSISLNRTTLPIAEDELRRLRLEVARLVEDMHETLIQATQLLRQYR